MTVRNKIDVQFTKLVTDEIINAFRRAYNQINKLSLDEMRDIDQIIDIISQEYDQSAVVNSDYLYNMSRSQYGAAIRQVQAQIRQQLTDYKYLFDRIDRDQLNILDQNNTLFIGKYFTEQAEAGIRSELAKIITEQQTKKDTAAAIADMLTIQGKYANSYSRMLVETNGTWSRSIAKSTALEDAGFTEYTYQVTVDDVTSPICQALAGKTNRVENALRTRDNYLSIDTSNYNRAKSQLENFSPFIRETADGFEAGGRSYTAEQIMQIPGIALPPFHPNCRTEIVVLS